MVCLPAERLRTQELILNANLPALSLHCPLPPPQLSFLLVESIAVRFPILSPSLSVSPAVPYHSPVELTTQPTVSLSFVAGVMKH